MRTFGLDVGTKTIGVAVSDALGLTAQSVTTVRRTSLKADLAALGELRASTRSPASSSACPSTWTAPRALAPRPRASSVSPSPSTLGLPVEFWDERLTTVAAQRTLLEADLSRAKRKEVIDQVAAQFILQGWMDARRPADSFHADDYDYDPEP